MTKASAMVVAGAFLSVGLMLLVGRSSEAVAMCAAVGGLILSVAGAAVWLRRATPRTCGASEARAIIKSFRLVPLWIFPSILLGELGGGLFPDPPVLGFIGAILAMILSVASFTWLAAGFSLWMAHREELLFQER